MSTAAHDSSLTSGGWSAKTLATRVMLADGSIITGVTLKTRPALLHALKTSAGRVGIILDVKLAIVKQRKVLATFFHNVSRWGRT
jgi:hypothetical protein